MTHGAIRKGRRFEELQASHLYCHRGKGSSLQLTIVRGDHSPRPTSGTIDGAPVAFWGLSGRNNGESDDGDFSILV